MLNAFANYNNQAHSLLYLMKSTPFHQRLKPATYVETLQKHCRYDRPTDYIIKNYCYEEKELMMYSFLFAAKDRAIRKHFTLKNYSKPI